MINLKWLTKKDQEINFEAEYIENLLLNNLKNSDKYQYVYNIVAYSNDNDKQLPDIKNEKADLYIHLSNENLNHYYIYFDSSDICLRSYYNPLIRHENTYTIPLGFQSGYQNKANIKTKNEKYVWSFIGQIKNHRRKMYEVFKRFGPHYVHFSSGWNSKDQLSIDDARKIYADTTFALCPFGNINPDSFRIMESLEWGCIPVVIKFYGQDYFKYVFGNHPFIIGKNWQEAAEICKDLMKNEKKLNQKKEEVQIWYKNYKDKLMKDIENIANGKKELFSEQFAIQEKGKENEILKFIFLYHFSKFNRIKNYINGYFRK